MDDGLKQRLIGAVVLLALAVIFVPVIFDREQLQPVDRHTQIPIAPEITPVVVPEPEITADVEPAPPIEDVFVPEEPSAAGSIMTTSLEPQAGAAELDLTESGVNEPRLTREGIPEAWVLQVASFKSAERAQELRDKLIAEGYTAYTQLVQADQGSMTRLFVGPKLDKGRLLEEQAAIEEKFQLSTFILKFTP
jgi:DedD protein